MRKLKTPEGELFEEFMTASIHRFSDGEIGKNSLHENEGGEYTGRFWFEFTNGKTTSIFTEKTAPKWLLAYYKQITTAN